MIISPKKRNATSFSRLMSWTGWTKSPTDDAAIINESQFRQEIEKERSRVDRRKIASEFAIILVSGIDVNSLGEDSKLLFQFRERLRITDSIGVCGDRLGLLLPETNRVGAKIVASDLGQMARCYVNDVQFEFLVYPEDDEVANNSIEFQSLHFLDDEELDSKSEADCIEQAIRGHGVESSKSDVLVDSAPTPLWKRIIDVFGASLGLVLLSPVFAVAAFAVKLSGPGPVLFRQLREGKDGRPFEILKFRTMCDEAESIQHGLREFSEQDGPAFKLEKDPRLTKVGKYLRVTCIDELPQLVNVLLGQMSLVGPRPLPVSESVECLIWQRRRLQVVPGITCIWQLQGDRTTKFEDWMRMDMEYIRKRSFWFDLQLILKTVGKVLLHRGSV